MQETWKPVVGYEELYEVSDAGNVRRSKPYNNSKPGNLKASIVSGYPRVSLSKNNRVKAALVHRLVADAFIGLPDGMVVNHLNGIRTDNNLRNLEVCTQADNNRHMVAVLQRWNKNFTKLTEDQVSEIRRLYSEGMTLKPLAKMFGVLNTNIWHIVHRKTWKHVP